MLRNVTFELHKKMKGGEEHMKDSTGKVKGTTGLAAGLAVGAAFGAAAVALSDKKNQEKVKDSITKVKKWAVKTTEKLKSSEGTDNAIKEAEGTTHKVIKERDEE